VLLQSAWVYMSIRLRVFLVNAIFIIIIVVVFRVLSACISLIIIIIIIIITIVGPLVMHSLHKTQAVATD